MGRSILHGLVGGLLLGCAGQAPPGGTMASGEDGVTAGSPGTMAGAAGHQASSTASVSDAAGAPSGTPPAGSGSAAAAGAPPTFHVVARLPGPTRFAPIQGRTFLISDGPTLSEIVGQRLTYVGDRAAGMEKPFDALGRGEIAAIAGRWPDRTWLALNARQPVGGTSHVYQWAGDRWTEKKKLARYATAATAWAEGTALVLVETTDGRRSELVQVPATPARTLPRFSDAQGDCQLIGKRLRGFASGELVAQGVPCGPDERGGRIAHWPAGAAHGVVADLPDIDGDLFGVVALATSSPGDTYVAGWSGPDKNHPKAPYLARFDGLQVQLEKPPMSGPLVDLALDSAGQLWCIERTKAGARKLWRRSPAKGWSTVSLPKQDGQPVVAERVWAPGPTDVWVVARAGRQRVLLHTQAAAEVVDLPATHASEYQSLRAATAGCSPLLVILSETGKGKTAPFTAGRARGVFGSAGGRVMLVEYRRRGKACLGAVAYTLPQARMYAELAQKQLPGAKPRIVCHEPRNRQRMFVYDPVKKQWQAGVPGKGP